MCTASKFEAHQEILSVSHVGLECSIVISEWFLPNLGTGTRYAILIDMGSGALEQAPVK